MELGTLRDLYRYELRDLYSLERQLLSSLPHIAERASHPNLRRLFSHHLSETQNQLDRLEQIFDRLGETERIAECLGVRGILREADHLLELPAVPQVLDAALIAVAQRIEHYEIAAYGCARTYARLLGDDWAAYLLQLSLEEECNADRHLSALAERAINVRAR